MNIKNHAVLYVISVVLLSIPGFIYLQFTWRFVLALLSGFFIINPDYDLLLGIKYHRWFFTHSLLYPTALYWILRDYINMETAHYLGVIFYFPCLIHMIGDFKVKHLIDTKKQRGSWLIATFGKRFNEKQTYVWHFTNVTIMGVYIILVLTEQWIYVINFLGVN